MAETGSFRHCSTCKKPIEFGAAYFVCSVSTCNRKRIGLFFCSVPCWDAHLPEARHRDAWAEEQRAPTREEAEDEQGDAVETEERKTLPSPDAAARRRIVAPAASAPDDEDDAELPKDVLVVVSKLKAYVKARSGMSTSDGVTGVLSDHLRRLCNEAIRNAARDDRKTVMDRDFTPLVK